MQLKYRGSTYDYNPPQVEMEPAKVVGQYRGLEWRFRNPKKVPVLQPNLDLVYRGVAYRTGEATVNGAMEGYRAPEVQKPKVAAAVNSTKDLARSLMMTHHTDIKRREQSLLSRSAAEVGIDASRYWQPLQGKISSAFRSTYDRSHAALS
ncbi:DUF4278 domain-containing protein [Synechococcales cyanobacterium C]|uniref:DUF4278 domain-containing protein n=1 Tax=Petrachloros mirabilis ULC683 TaxID=2781853 RepID=A0A8K2A7W4_9CYAN|nr:DUF4278 domain-containing protein [Petrachloros mirabilis]NCJ07326.1 DUF4278 domain-containing protein [Petrachloros mirabilis ULC683]